MFYKVPIDSETGKKFAKMQIKIDDCHAHQVQMADKYGFEQWRSFHFFYGSISSVIFPIGFVVDTTKWKLRRGTINEYFPNKRNKAGKAIDADFRSMKQVPYCELNKCIGWDGDVFTTIGFDCSTEYFGFTTQKKWGITVPADCVEITETEWDSIFK